MLKYQENNYFNHKDNFIIYYEALKSFKVDKCHFYNGNWYNNTGNQFKLTSVKTINCNELL